MHYYKRNIGDYHKKAGRLSMLQHGAYTLLIDSCYDREKFPTKEEAIDWAWASSKEEIEAVEFVLKKFFKLEDGVYIQKQIKENVCKYQANSLTNKRIAIDRERKRRETNEKENETDCDDKSTVRAQSVNEPPPNHKPLTINQEPLTINKEPKASKKSSSLVKNTTLVFDHWKNETGHKKSKLDDARKKKIKFGLANFSVDDCLEAISGCVKTPHNQGDNDRNTEYLSISVIFKNAEQIERFIRNNKNPPAPSRANFWNEKGGFNAGNQEVRQHQKQSTVDGAVERHRIFVEQLRAKNGNPGGDSGFVVEHVDDLSRVV